MKTPNSSSARTAITIGLDLGDRKHAVCMLDAEGFILKQESIANNRPSITALSRRYPGSLIASARREWQPALSSFLGSELDLAGATTYRWAKNS